MVGATLTMGHIYGGAMEAIVVGTNAVVFGMARRKASARLLGERSKDRERLTTPY